MGLRLAFRHQGQRGFPVTNPQQKTVTSPLPTSLNLHLPFCILAPHMTVLGGPAPRFSGQPGVARQMQSP